MTEPHLLDPTVLENEAAADNPELLYRDLFVTSRDALYITSTDGRVLACNPAFVLLLGYSPLELASIHVHELYADKSERERFEAEVMKRGWTSDFETVLQRKDGTTRECLLTASVRRRPDGSILGYQGSIRDITEFKHLQRELSHAQKMESVGQLAAGIAHEINTPTQYVSDNVHFLTEAFARLRPRLEALRSESQLEQETDADDLGFLLEQIPQALSESLEGLKRVTSIVVAMKDFAHPGVTDRTPMNIKRIVESTATVSRNEWKYVANLRIDVPENVGQIEGYAGELSQALLNLVVNAAHAIGAKRRGEKGEITIRVVPHTDTVDVSVHDTGCGIPEYLRDRVFDPFFTTKEVGRGTGQGLALVRSVVVDKHGGSIDLESTENVGTTVTFRLPRTYPGDKGL